MGGVPAIVFPVFLAGILGFVPVRPFSQSQRVVTRNVFLMGTTATFHVRSRDRESGIDQIESAVDVLEKTERELSTWIGESALSRINRSEVDRPVPTDRSTCELLATLQWWRTATGGAFDPAVGSLIDIWGLRDGGRLASRGEVDRALAASGLDHWEIEFVPEGCTVTRRRDVRIDAGAFGKGAALDRVARRPPPGAWMIDLGGQIGVGGGHSWTLALSHPRRRDLEVARVVMQSGSLATSGGSEHDVNIGGRRVGHIVDPRTGSTVVSDVSVVVWHSEALVADILSTALYVMGPEEGFEWAERLGIAAAFLIPEERDGDAVEIRATTSFVREFPEVGAERRASEFPTLRDRASERLQ